MNALRIMGDVPVKNQVWQRKEENLASGFPCMCLKPTERCRPVFIVLEGIVKGPWVWTLETVTKDKLEPAQAFSKLGPTKAH